MGERLFPVKIPSRLEENASFWTKILPKGSNVPRAEVRKRREREKRARASRRRNRKR